MSTTTNGKPQRKQLSDQLDRFDALLDGLADGLNDAIADAVRDGTRLALKDAVIEILTDPKLRSRLQQAAGAERTESVSPAPARGGFWSWLKAKATGAVTAAKMLGSVAASAAAHAAQAVVNTVKDPGRAVRKLGHMKGALYVGVGAGLAISAVSFLAPHAVSASLAGLSSGIAAMALRATVWTRRTLSLSCFV